MSIFNKIFSISALENPGILLDDSWCANNLDRLDWEGQFDLLHSFLRCSNPAVQVRALAELSDLARVPEIRAKMGCDVEFMRMIKSCLARDTVDFKLMTLAVFCNLAIDCQVLALIAKDDELLGMLKDCLRSSNEDLQLKALKVLTNMASGDVFAEQVFEDEELMGMLKDCLWSSNEDFQVKALNVISNSVCSSRALSLMFSDSELIELLKVCLLKEDGPVAVASTNIVNNLWNVSDSKVSLYENGVFMNLLKPWFYSRSQAKRFNLLLVLGGFSKFSYLQLLMAVDAGIVSFIRGDFSDQKSQGIVDNLKKTLRLRTRDRFLRRRLKFPETKASESYLFRPRDGDGADEKSSLLLRQRVER